MIPQTFALKQFTVCAIFSQVDLEPWNMVVVCIGKHPNFDAIFIWLHWHVLFKRQPPVEFY